MHEIVLSLNIDDDPELEEFAAVNVLGVTAAGAADAPDPIPEVRVTVPPRLLTAQPNPFRDATTLAFELDAPREETEVAIYDVAGRLVRSLRAGQLGAGSHAITWNGLNESGARAPQGIYFARLRAGEQHLGTTILRIR
jgi:hypothetical protein